MTIPVKCISYIYFKLPGYKFTKKYHIIIDKQKIIIIFAIKKVHIIKFINNG